MSSTSSVFDLFCPRRFRSGVEATFFLLRQTKFPPPDSILTAKLEPLKLSRSETRKSLSTIETTLRNLRSELALADIMEELDETKRLKEALDSAGQEKEQYPAKLAEIEVKMKGVE